MLGILYGTGYKRGCNIKILYSCTHNSFIDILKIETASY